MKKPGRIASCGEPAKTDAMTTASPARDQIILLLYDLFRRQGFDAVSIADISAATGLGKSSLYYHFPGGKADMAAAVAAFARAWMRENIGAPLGMPAPLPQKINAMMKTTAAMYEGGGAPCLVASLMLSPNLGPEAGADTKGVISDWIAALAQALRSAGVADARRRATEAIIAIEGALIVARATGERRVFDQALKSAAAALVAGM
jgi:AcrR family transcriptional regulator